MNKEELTRALKYTEEKHRNDTVDTFDTNISMMCADVLNVLKNCIEIPEGATNGDMIKAMFPECCSNMGNLDNRIVVDFMGDLHTFNKDWWNAPYKKEVEE